MIEGPEELLEPKDNQEAGGARVMATRSCASASAEKIVSKKQKQKRLQMLMPDITDAKEREKRLVDEESAWLMPGRTKDGKGIKTFTATYTKTLFSRKKDAINTIVIGTNGRIAVALCELKEGPASAFSTKPVDFQWETFDEEAKAVRESKTREEHEKARNALEDKVFQQNMRYELVLRKAIADLPFTSGPLYYKLDSEALLIAAYMKHMRIEIKTQLRTPMDVAAFCNRMKQERRMLPALWKVTGYLEQEAQRIMTRKEEDTEEAEKDIVSDILTQGELMKLVSKTIEEHDYEDHEQDDEFDCHYYTVSVCPVPSQKTNQTRDKDYKAWKDSPLGFFPIKCEKGSLPLVAFDKTHLSVFYEQVQGHRLVLETYEIIVVDANIRFNIVARRAFEIPGLLDDTIVSNPSLPADAVAACDVCGTLFTLVSSRYWIMIGGTKNTCLFLDNPSNYFTCVRYSMSSILAGTSNGQVFVADVNTHEIKLRLSTAVPEPIFDAYFHGTSHMMLQLATGILVKNLDESQSVEVLKECFQPVASACCGSLLFIQSRADMLVIFTWFDNASYMVRCKMQDPIVYTPKFQAAYRGLWVGRKHLVMVDQNGLVRRVDLDVQMEAQKKNMLTDDI